MMVPCHSLPIRVTAAGINNVVAEPEPSTSPLHTILNQFHNLAFSQAISLTFILMLSVLLSIQDGRSQVSPPNMYAEPEYKES
jgi:hypothetical protein